jgi:REP element-mobilizing transposase RayT
MTNKTRDFQRHTYYHIYNRGNNKEIIFKHPEDKRFFISLLYRFRKETDLLLDSYVIMNNHYHVILRTGYKPNAISKYMQQVGTTYAMYANSKYSRVGHIFQGRYKAKKLRFKKDVRQTREYLKQNPVVEGYVKTAVEYPWAKIHSD